MSEAELQSELVSIEVSAVRQSDPSRPITIRIGGLRIDLTERQARGLARGLGHALAEYYLVGGSSRHWHLVDAAVDHPRHAKAICGQPPMRSYSANTLGWYDVWPLVELPHINKLCNHCADKRTRLAERAQDE